MSKLRDIIFNNDYSDTAVLETTLHDALDQFLQSHIELNQESHDSIDGDDLGELHDIFMGIVAAKWQQDYGGMLPVEFIITDSTAYYTRYTKIAHKTTMDDLWMIAGGIRTLSDDLSRGAMMINEA